MLTGLLFRQGEAGDKSTGENIFIRRIILSFLLPFLFVSLLWLIKIFESLTGIELSGLGIKPLSAGGLPGILAAPFIHEDFRHLFNNSLPLLFLSTMIFYFYPDAVFRIIFFTWIITGTSVWLAGRMGVHIGSSGLVYGFASFLFFSGILKKHLRLIALSLLIVFMYGEMVWGLFPGVGKSISWESHMLGFISGILLSIICRNKGPQPPVPEWLNNEEEEERKDSDKL